MKVQKDVNVRVYDREGDLRKAIAELCERDKQTISQVVRKAIRAYARKRGVAVHGK